MTTLTISLVSLFFCAATPAGAQTMKVLHDFLRNGVDGYLPIDGLTFDSSGNLYGVTGNGGAYSYGAVFELLPKGGGWVERIVHSFNPQGGVDGYGPNGPLTFASAGNIYGTTGSGPNWRNNFSLDNGTVFEMTPLRGGGFSEKVLYSFKGYNASYKDGELPWANVILDSAGNLYGTTRYGGAHNWGTVFELSPSGSGTWTEQILFSFDNTGDSGCQPFGGLVFDSAGNLYGTTNECGANSNGTVYKLSNSGGVWTQTILHAFTGYTGTINDGSTPYSGVTFDSSGNLYGVTQLGGLNGGGVAYELSPQSDGSWTETLLYNFGASVDVGQPFYAPVFDSAGNLYGTGGRGGTYGGGGIWKLTPGSGGAWTESVLYNFNTRGEDFNIPTSGVILDSLGNLYGETQLGGSEDGGDAYEFIP